MDRIYFDYNATCIIRPEVVELMTEIMRQPGNASSVHNEGRTARKYIEAARKTLADMIGTEPSKITFTSGATESNNTILKAFDLDKIWITGIEHSSIREVAKGTKIIPVTIDGLIDLDALEKMLRTEDKPDLISVMMVNSETGTIQPIADVVKLAHEHDIKVHTDAVQALGRIDINMKELGVDYLSLSAHKVGGPQGVGALIVGMCADLPRWMDGGTQENHKRAGTENVAGIAGFGKAAELAQNNYDQYQILGTYRSKLQDGMRSIVPEMKVFGENAPRTANTLNISWPGQQSSMLLMNLDLEGVSVSTGSACSSGSMKPSQVLTAMGASEDEALGALRISMGWNTKAEEVERFLEIWEKIARRIQSV